MQALLIQLALFCQADAALPPPPPPAPIANNGAVVHAIPGAQSTQDLRDWLLARLVVDLGFDVQKSNEVKELLTTMDDKQVRFLVDYYKERAAQRAQPIKQASATAEQQAAEQAALNLQQLEAYRDHLRREFDLKVLNGQMNQNLLYQNMINNQRLSYLSYGPYAYVPGFGYGGFGGRGFGPMGFGGYGFGAPGYGFGMPGYGSAVIYGGPMYGNGVGVGFY